MSVFHYVFNNTTCLVSSLLNFIQSLKIHCKTAGMGYLISFCSFSVQRLDIRSILLFITSTFSFESYLAIIDCFINVLSAVYAKDYANNLYLATDQTSSRL